MEIKSILNRKTSDLALVIGNGINLYGPSQNTNSWYDLLVKLSKKHLPESQGTIPDGISLTEFYDVLELKTPPRVTEHTLQQGFCDLMKNWKFYKHHEHVVNWAAEANVPILTTNFEQVLANAGDCKMYRTQKGGFTDFYPWQSYYGHRQIDNPARDFAIWHLNGMQRYHRSICLGLTHYMGSVARARGMIHKGDRRLSSGNNPDTWAGASSWLQVIFNCNLMIFGLGLGENEVFLRWLLIERAKHFKHFPKFKKQGWYVYADDDEDTGKLFFLEGVGITSVKVDSYDDIYGADVWS
jgi:hypothetical protein